VVDEHVDALNKCDWGRLMAQYPEEVAILLPGGVTVSGRKSVGDLFAGFCKAPADGGLKGLTFTAISAVVVGDTLNVQWRADADFLAEPYVGADAYVTKDGLMYAQVSTFDGAELKMK
jgi:ketosteroid isomerase-like protein